jgi:hypothetical protein
MTVHQISIWVRLSAINPSSLTNPRTQFQNRRTRVATRANSRRKKTAPRTFEEMKASLSAPARRALEKPHPLLKKLNPDPADHAVSDVPILAPGPPMRAAVPAFIVLDAGTSSGPGTRAVSLEAGENTTSPEPRSRAVSLEAPDDGSPSDECDELADHEFLVRFST